MSKKSIQRWSLIKLSLLSLPAVVLPVSMASNCEEPNQPVLISDEGYIYVEWSNQTVSLMGFENMGTEVVIPEFINGMEVVGLGYTKSGGGIWSMPIEVPCEGAGITKLTFSKMGAEFNNRSLYANFPDVHTVEYIDPLTHGTISTIWGSSSKPIGKVYYINVDFDLYRVLPALATVKLSKGENNNIRSDEDVKHVYIGSWGNKFKYKLTDNILSETGLIIGTDLHEPDEQWSDSWCGENKVFVNTTWSDFTNILKPKN